jgi:hypothetical protein
MNTTPSSGTRHYMESVGILLLAVALIAGMAGCTERLTEFECSPVFATGAFQTVGLQSDGKVVATRVPDPDSHCGQSNAGSWDLD